VSVVADTFRPVTRDVTLRPIEDADLDALFELMRDPESVRMAAFTAEDPDDRAAFDTHMARIRTSAEVTCRAVVRDGHFVGTIGCFVWGQGVAGRALALFLEIVAVRPLHARVAGDNAGSLRVLRRAGFETIGTEVSFANARNAEIEETILRLG
jgi:RimJ/RimL family protein N-acetyltransferase